MRRCADGRDEDVAVPGRLRERVRVRGAVVPRKRLEPPGEQATGRVAQQVRDLIDRDRAGLRVDLVQPVLDVVGDVNEAVRCDQHVVRLRHDVADGPFGDGRVGKRGRPRGRVGHQCGVVAQLPVALGQLRGHRPLVRRGQARPVADHAIDDVAPDLGCAVHANELVALLVTERTLQHEVLLRVRVADVERAEPRIGGLRRSQRHWIGLARHDHDRRRFAGHGRRDESVAEPRLAQPVTQTLRAIR